MRDETQSSAAVQCKLLNQHSIRHNIYTVQQTPRRMHKLSHNTTYMWHVQNIGAADNQSDSRTLLSLSKPQGSKNFNYFTRKLYISYNFNFWIIASHHGRPMSRVCRSCNCPILGWLHLTHTVSRCPWKNIATVNQWSTYINF